MGIWAMTVVQAHFYEEGFSPSRVFLFFPGLFSQRFSFTCLCSRVFCPFEGCKAVSIATLCNAELGPLGYKTKVENDSSIYVELSNSDHCYLLRILSVRAQTFCRSGL